MYHCLALTVCMCVCAARCPRAGRAEEKQAAEFFDSSNAAAKVQREQMAMQVLEELLTWLGAAQRTTHAWRCRLTRRRRRWRGGGRV